MFEFDLDSELYHHGIKGQKWGVRRFQNEDGSLTEAGRKRYSGSAQQRQLFQDLKANHRKSNAFENDQRLKTARESLRPYSEKYHEFDKQYQKEASPLFQDRKLFDSYSKKTLGADNQFDLDWFWNHPIKIAQTKGYLKDKNPELLKKHQTAWKEYEAQSKYLAHELLGKYGQTKLYELGKDTAADSLAIILRKMK